MDLQSMLSEANAYFLQLSDEEKYGWIAMVIGLVLFAAGIVLFFW
jgi:hypothetical protein